MNFITSSDVKSDCDTVNGSKEIILPAPPSTASALYSVDSSGNNDETNQVGYHKQYLNRAKLIRDQNMFETDSLLELEDKQHDEEVMHIQEQPYSQAEEIQTIIADNFSKALIDALCEDNTKSMQNMSQMTYVQNMLNEIGDKFIRR